MDITYRLFSKTDFRDLVSLADDEWKINHNNIAISMMKATGDVEQCIVALDNKQIVGYIYGFSLPNKTLLPEFLYVLPAYRKHGIGKSLLNELEITTKCTASMIFYHKSLHDYYSKLGYQAGEALEVALKEIPVRKEQLHEV